MIGQQRLQLRQRDVGCRIVSIQDQTSMRFDPRRPSVTALPVLGHVMPSYFSRFSAELTVHQAGWR